MTTLVHITGVENAKKIVKNGINISNERGLVFFMPLMKDYYISYQWWRELKRSGIKNFAAILFKLKEDDLVWHGKYNEKHQKDDLKSAVSKFYLEEDKMGYEFFIDKRIESSQIVKLIEIKKPLGWRYFPKSHDRKPCFCPACVVRGEYGSGENRKKWILENDGPVMKISEAKEIIGSSGDINLLHRAILRFDDKKRKLDPEFLFRIFELNDEILNYTIIRVLANFKHPKTKKKLFELSSSPDLELAEFAREIIESMYSPGGSA